MCVVHTCACLLPVPRPTGYLPHIGALLVSPIVQKCSRQGKDIRTADLSTLRDVTGGLYSEQELERLAFFVKQEVCSVCVCVCLCVCVCVCVLIMHTTLVLLSLQIQCIRKLSALFSCCHSSELLGPYINYL